MEGDVTWVDASAVNSLKGWVRELRGRGGGIGDWGLGEMCSAWHRLFQLRSKGSEKKQLYGDCKLYFRAKDLWLMGKHPSWKSLISFFYTILRGVCSVLM